MSRSLARAGSIAPGFVAIEGFTDFVLYHLFLSSFTTPSSMCRFQLASHVVASPEISL